MQAAGGSRGIDAFALVGNRFGEFDVPCPLCGPQRKAAANRRKCVLRIWRSEENFAGYFCARCGASGYSRGDGCDRSRLSDQRRQSTSSPPAKTDAERTAYALARWHEAEPLGELALTYFESRGIVLAKLPDAHSVLRFHPRCVFGKCERHPCIIALWTDALTGEPKAIHRTALKPDGTKLGRMSLGPIGGCVIRLWPDWAVESGLVVGEGLETVLAPATRMEHRGTLLRPAWALGDKGHLTDFPVLPGIEALTILVDHDNSEAGQLAASKCKQRWLAAGREVITLIPNARGKDFNDLVKASPS